MIAIYVMHSIYRYDIMRLLVTRVYNQIIREVGMSLV